MTAKNPCSEFMAKRQALTLASVEHYNTMVRLLSIPSNKKITLPGGKVIVTPIKNGSGVEGSMFHEYLNDLMGDLLGASMELVKRYEEKSDDQVLSDLILKSKMIMDVWHAADCLYSSHSVQRLPESQRGVLQKILYLEFEPCIKEYLQTFDRKVKLRIAMDKQSIIPTLRDIVC